MTIPDPHRRIDYSPLCILEQWDFHVLGMSLWRFVSKADVTIGKYQYVLVDENNHPQQFDITSDVFEVLVKLAVK